MLIVEVDYRAIFALQFVMMIVDLAILWKIDEGLARREVDQVEQLEQAFDASSAVT